MSGGKAALYALIDEFCGKGGSSANAKPIGKALHVYEVRGAGDRYEGRSGHTQMLRHRDGAEEIARALAAPAGDWL